MPQGKGTYGSKVGRPPKKKYQAGGAVRPPVSKPKPKPKSAPNFPQENPAVRDANKMGQEMESIPLGNFPSSNAMNRRKVSPMGSEVGTGVYKEGGKVDVTDIVKATSDRKRHRDALIKQKEYLGKKGGKGDFSPMIDEKGDSTYVGDWMMKKQIDSSKFMKLAVSYAKKKILDEKKKGKKKK